MLAPHPGPGSGLRPRGVGAPSQTSPAPHGPRRSQWAPGPEWGDAASARNSREPGPGSHAPRPFDPGGGAGPRCGLAGSGPLGPVGPALSGPASRPDTWLGLPPGVLPDAGAGLTGTAPPPAPGPCVRVGTVRHAQLPEAGFRSGHPAVRQGYTSPRLLPQTSERLTGICGFRGAGVRPRGGQGLLQGSSSWRSSGVGRGAGAGVARAAGTGQEGWAWPPWALPRRILRPLPTPGVPGQPRLLPFILHFCSS